MIQYNTNIGQDIDKIPEGKCHIVLEETPVNGAILDNETIRRGVDYQIGSAITKIYKNGEVLRFNDLNYSTYKITIQGNIYRVHTNRAKKSLTQCMIKRLEATEEKMSNLFEEECKTDKQEIYQRFSYLRNEEVIQEMYINAMIQTLITYTNLSKIDVILDLAYEDYCKKFGFNPKTFVYEEQDI